MWVLFPVILIQFIFCNSLQLSVKDVTDIVTLLILIIKLIAKLRNCIRYFRRSGQTLVRSNVTGGDGSIDNQTGIKLQNVDDKYYLEFHVALCSVRAFFFLFPRCEGQVFLPLKSIGLNLILGAIIVSFFVVLSTQKWTLFLIFSTAPFLCIVFPYSFHLGPGVCVLWFVLWLLGSIKKSAIFIIFS